MRTTTKINWVRSQVRDAEGNLTATNHTGQRANWVFRITTLPGGRPGLWAGHIDGRRITSLHDTLGMAKAAALDLMHPAEAMAWVNQSGVTRYTAFWDDLKFVAYMPGEVLYFQYGTADGFRSAPVAVSGIREARQLAARVLRDRFPTQSPTAAPEAAQGALADVNAMETALMAAGITYTSDQLLKAAQTLAEWNAEARPYE